MRLFFMRHAKSAWPQGVDDRERPLLPAGKERAAKRAAQLREQGAVPARVVTSPAVRAHQTASIVAEALGLELAVDERLYGADPRSLVAVGAEYGEGTLVVAHNPGMEELTFHAAVLADMKPPLRIRTGSISICDVDGDTVRLVDVVGA